VNPGIPTHAVATPRSIQLLCGAALVGHAAFSWMSQIMAGDETGDTSLLDLPATSRQSWSAGALATVLLVGCGALVPFAGSPLSELNAFFPSLDAIVFVTDLITSVLLFAQFSIYQSRSLLVLASGYLFTALIVVPHALTFSGAFSPTGLLGASIQTGSWLYIFWHFGFAAALLAYAVLREEKGTKSISEASMATAISWSVAIVCALVCGLAWLATAGSVLLPAIILDKTHISPSTFYYVAFVILISAAALTVLWVSHRSSVLDQWLMVVALASILELVFGGLLPTIRFSLGFYASRGFSLATATVVLVVLLAETTRLYARLSRTNIILQHERNSKLMNMEAMIASISHEVRQPLGAIAANGDAALLFLGNTPPKLEKVRSALEMIVSDSYRASQVFDSIRSLVRSTDRALESVDVNDVVLAVLRDLRRELNDHGVITRTALTPELPLVMGHRGQLQEVMLNLVQNAIDAMDGVGRGNRILHVKTEYSGRDAIAVAVEDSGSGIEPEKLDGIFDVFVTTKSNGMGLGLALCRMIIERHQGQLSASSNVKTGARFQFILPIQTGAASIAPYCTHLL
jgi:signal transduction histidine kinase